MTKKQIQSTYNRIANDDSMSCGAYEQEIISELLDIINSELLTN